MKRVRTKYPEESVNKRFVVYRIYCKISKRSYIGITADFNGRLAVHWYDARNGKGTVLAKAIRKYGKRNFLAFKIDSSDLWSDVCEKEIHYIKSLKTRTPHGYNMTDGGDGIPGIEMTAETREKMRQSHLGKAVGSDNPMYGKPGTMLGKKWTQEQRKKFSESRMGRIPWNKGKKCPQLCGENNGFYGRKHSEETLEKIRKSRKGYVWSDETREKILKSREGCQIGEKHSLVKLTEANVIDIRERYASGKVTQYQLAEEFGVTQGNINCVIKRVSWRHI